MEVNKHLDNNEQTKEINRTPASKKNDVNSNNNNGYMRSTAIKTDINSLKKGNFIQQEGFKPSYIATIYGNISRVNIIGVIVSKSLSENTIFIDDGSDNIELRKSMMDQNSINFDDYSPGDLVRMIGKVRSYNDTNYIVPEIIKKVENKKWIEVRKLELEKREKVKFEENIEKPRIIPKVSQENVQENEDKPKKKDNVEKILEAIRKKDTGDGVDFESLLEEIGISDGDAHLKKLLEQGEIFEIRPGRVKVLE